MDKDCIHKWETEIEFDLYDKSYPKTIVVFCNRCGIWTRLQMPPIDTLEEE